MITHQVIDITEVKTNAIAHQANCQHIMAGGVAFALRKKYPEVYEADLKTVKSSRKKLGTYSHTLTHDYKTVFNVYSQFDLSAGVGDRATLYDMVDIGLRAVHECLIKTLAYTPSITLAIPYKYGCALGGGSWPVVEAIIRDIFEKSPIDVILCEWPPNVANDKLPMSALEKALNLGTLDTKSYKPFAA